MSSRNNGNISRYTAANLQIYHHLMLVSYGHLDCDIKKYFHCIKMVQVSEGEAERYVIC